MNVGPRMRVWRESNRQRVIMASDGPLVIYEGDYCMVVVGQSLEQCREVLCPMLKPEADK